MAVHQNTLIFLTGLALLLHGGRVTGDVVVNPDGVTYDSHPASAITSAGVTWIAWHGYLKGKDDVFVRRHSPPGELGPIVRLSDTRISHSPPALAVNDSHVFVVWASEAGNRWSVVARYFDGAAWSTPASISSPEVDGVHPTVAAVGDGQFVIAWSAYERGHFARIQARSWEQGAWLEVRDISDGTQDAHRPSLATEASGEAWVAWDQYDGQHYQVMARQLAPELADIESVATHADALAPTVNLASGRPAIAWLQKMDVIGGPGVISQWHTLHVAIRKNRQWVDVRDQAGSTVGATLTQGLVAKIHPEAVPTGGYLGRRTAPILAEVGGSLWLFWERKTDHLGPTWNVLGDLLGRRIDGETWDQPVAVDTGLIDYRMIEPPVGHQEKLQLLASQLPRQERRLYRQKVVDLSSVQAFSQERWDGWAPVELPIESQLVRRHQITVDGKTLKLFWGDLHCHSGLTADAEGEADELFHYARDRARLDVVVFTNNDFIYDVPLTQYEYAMSNFLSRVHTRPDFLAFPGYEWTSRIPGDGTAFVSDTGNWTQPYQNASYPNHRTVIYPPTGGPLIHFTDAANNIHQLYAAVASANGVVFTQHEAFQVTGNPIEVGMELTSGWRRYVSRRTKLFHDALDRGYRLGFMASGDTHRRAPGLSGALTGIYATDLTSESILDALRHRRYFATSGSRIFVDSRVNGRFMGTEVQSVDGKVLAAVEAEGVAPIGRAVLILDGEEIATYEGDGSKTLRIEHRLLGLSPGEHWCYWRLEQSPDTPDLPGNLNPAFGHLAWSTPHWIRVGRGE